MVLCQLLGCTLITDKPLNIAVIGGGPAGMSAAKYLAKKGHKVELFEKEDKPGGQRGCRTFIEALKDEKGNMQIFSGMVLNAINK